MKILLFYSSHRQLKEFELSSGFFNRFKFLKPITDVMIYCDNNLISIDQIKECARYEARSVEIIKGDQVFPSGINTGISGNGIHIGLGKCFNRFMEYDYVINMVPDCYITDDSEIWKLLQEEEKSENNFIVDYHPYLNHSSLTQFCCDFFVFKPKNITNIFNELDMSNLLTPESFIYSKIMEYNIKHRIIQRVGSVYWNIDNFGMIHNHNLSRISKILYDDIDDKNLKHDG